MRWSARPNFCSTTTSRAPQGGDRGRARPSTRRGSRRPRRAAIATASPPPRQEGDRSRRAGSRWRSSASREHCELLTRGLTAIEARLEAEAVEVAVAVARKLAPELIAREPFAEIEALASDMLPPTDRDAACRRAHHDSALRRRLRAARRDRASGTASTAGWSCCAEPDIAAGDCRIEWADGGVTRDRAAARSARSAKPSAASSRRDTP